MNQHESHLARVRDEFHHAHGRLVARLKSVSPEIGARTPPGGGWSIAQIAWHVAAVDAVFAALLFGERPSQELPADFRARPWPEIVGGLPPKLEASGPAVPPPSVTLDEALSSLDLAAVKLDAALSTLTPDRGSRFGITHKVFGTVTLSQLGDWAVAHTIRHNAQAKRVINSLAASPSAGA